MVKRSFRRIVLLLILVGTGYGIWSARAPILTGIARAWIVSETPEAADAVAVLGGGVENRPAAAAALYHAGLAKKILVLQPELIRLKQPAMVIDEGAQTRQILEAQRVPPEDIVFIGRPVSSTYEEAQSLAEWTRNHRPRLLLIPTDPFHTRRARWILSRTLNPFGAQVRLIVVPPKRYRTEEWWRVEEGRRHFSNELIKFAWYFFRYSLVS